MEMASAVAEIAEEFTEIVAEDGGGVSEPVSGELHTVTGVTGQADGGSIQLVYAARDLV